MALREKRSAGAARSGAGERRKRDEEARHGEGDEVSLPGETQRDDRRADHPSRSEAPKALKLCSVPIAAARRCVGKRSLTSAPPTTSPGGDSRRLRAARRQEHADVRRRRGDEVGRAEQHQPPGQRDLAREAIDDRPVEQLAGRQDDREDRDRCARQGVVCAERLAQRDQARRVDGDRRGPKEARQAGEVQERLDRGVAVRRPLAFGLRPRAGRRGACRPSDFGAGDEQPEAGCRRTGSRAASGRPRPRGG